jgi:hypothetical protein
MYIISHIRAETLTTGPMIPYWTNRYTNYNSSPYQIKLLLEISTVLYQLRHFLSAFSSWILFCNENMYNIIGFVWFGFLVFNATINNISVISWRSVLLVEETWVPGENHRPAASYWQTLSHTVVSSTLRLSGVWTHNFSGDRHCLHR